MDTTYHHGQIIPDDNPSYTSITPTSSSKAKLQWLALLLPAAAALCLYICLQVRHTRRNIKKQHYNGSNNSNNINNGSSSPSSSDISTMTGDEWIIPSYYHYHHHDNTRTYSTYPNDYHHHQQELPLILFPGQQNSTTGIQRPPSVHHGPWRRYCLHQQDHATIIHGRRQNRHPHHQRRHRRRRPRTPPPAYQGIGFSPPPPSYEDIIQQPPLPPLLQQRLSNDNEPLAHIHSTLHSLHSSNTLTTVTTSSIQNNNHINT